MAIVKQARERTVSTYKYEGDVCSVIRYIGDLNKADYEICGARNVLGKSQIFTNPAFITSQFLVIQDGYYDNKRRIYHLICSFRRNELSVRNIQRVGNYICAMFPDYQSMFVLHQNTGNYHLHIVINNMPIFDGEPLLSTRGINLCQVNGAVKEFINSLKQKNTNNQNADSQGRYMYY